MVVRHGRRAHPRHPDVQELIDRIMSEAEEIIRGRLTGMLG